MWKCSYCGKENNDETPNCRGCGLPQVDEADEVAAIQTLTPQGQKRLRGKRLMWHGGLWVVGGIAISFFSYVSAMNNPGGGVHIIFIGAIIFGIVQFFRGQAMATGNDPAIEARELLALAAQLENVDRDKAMALYEEIVKSFPGTRAGEEAKRNIQTLAAHRDRE